MKKIYSLILAAIALFTIQFVTNAQPYTEINHIAYSKYPTGPVNGIYTIHLDTFVTGEVTVSTTKLPADIVLVLDVSGSMDEDYSTDSYVFNAKESQGYSYNNYNDQLWYLHTDGQYYQVSRGSYQTGGGWFSPSTTHYYLSVSLPYGTYYLNGTGITSRIPQNPTNGGSTIWTGVLYERELVEKGQSKLEALQAAVSDFIDVIQDNAVKNNVDNQIAIVKFAMNRYYGDNEDSIAEGDHHYYYSERYPVMNYTEVVKQFTKVKDNAQALKDAVNGLQAAGATAADFGMKKAELLLKDLISKNPKRESNKTVVLFTDGAPTYSDSFSETVADNTISNAHTIKGIKAYTDPKAGDVFTSVFTVGVFDNETTNIKNYMNYTSSNYPDAVGWDDVGDGNDEGYYQIASDKTDLSSIFRSIASQAGGSEATAVTAAATTTVDVVSQSFDLPYGADPSSISVHFATCTGVDENGYLTFDDDEENLIDNPAEGKDGHVTITIDEASQKITATGFDYSGNWCGKDESLGENEYHGMKLMLEIPIEMSDDAVGGNQVGTNGPESGIYVDGKPVLIFDVPHIDLPTNLHIKKEIANGECATFEIYRKKNQEGANWETKPFKTVMVIGGNNDNTVKLMGLDPHYLYKIVEAGWSWTYDLEKVTDKDGKIIEGEVTSDKIELNPFIFVNKKKDRQIRHAESAVYNDFRNAGAVEGIDSKPTSTSSSSEGGDTE